MKRPLIRLIPDWQNPKGLVLVWPETIYDDLMGFYTKFSEYIPEGIDLVLLVKDETTGKNILKKIPKGFIYVVIPKLMDIWIKDWAPIPAIDSNRNKVFIKTIFKPKYHYAKNAKTIDEVGNKLPSILGGKMINIKLILDGGNLTHNGNGVGIVTQRILKDNNNYSENDIHSLFKEYLGIYKLVIIPEEPDDKTGHIDGICRFLNPKTLLLGEYPKYFQKESRYISRVFKKLKYELGDDFTIIKILNGKTSEEKFEGIYSAEGNYINFLRLGSKILFPTYGLDNDDQINNLSKFGEIISINLPGIKILSSKGGILNCFSWAYY